MVVGKVGANNSDARSSVRVARRHGSRTRWNRSPSRGPGPVHFSAPHRVLKLMTVASTLQMGQMLLHPTLLWFDGRE